MPYFGDSQSTPRKALRLVKTLCGRCVHLLPNREKCIRQARANARRSSFFLREAGRDFRTSQVHPPIFFNTVKHKYWRLFTAEKAVGTAPLLEYPVARRNHLIQPHQRTGEFDTGFAM